MLPEKGSASEGSAVFCGEVYRSVCFAWFGLLVWLLYTEEEEEAKGKPCAMKNASTVWGGIFYCFILEFD